MARLVLTDASPLIGLARVEGLSWLRALFGEVWMPSEVQSEVLPQKGLSCASRPLVENQLQAEDQIAQRQDEEDGFNIHRRDPVNPARIERLQAARTSDRRRRTTP